MSATTDRAGTVIQCCLALTGWFAFGSLGYSQDNGTIIRKGNFQGMWASHISTFSIQEIHDNGTFDGVAEITEGRFKGIKFGFHGKIEQDNSLVVTRYVAGKTQVAQTTTPKLTDDEMSWSSETVGFGIPEDRSWPFTLTVSILPRAPSTIETNDIELLVFAAMPAEQAQAGNADRVRGKIETNLKHELNILSQVCSLTEGQQKKLQLSGRGDIAKFLDEVGELRQKYSSRPLDPQERANATKAIQSLCFRTQAIPVRANSLFQKALQNNLTDEQRPIWLALVRKRRVRVVDDALDGIIGGNLVGEQRTKFIETLVENSVIPQTTGLHDRFIVLHDVERTQERLKPLCTDAQWAVLQVQFESVKQLAPGLREVVMELENR